MNTASSLQMVSLWWAPAIALFLWWLSTAALLFLNHLPRKTYIASLVCMTALMLFSISQIPSVSDQAITYRSACFAFLQGLLIWAWLEMTYFMGFITGPSSAPCPAQTTGFARFKKALDTSLYHESLIVLFGFILWILSWQGENRIAFYTFAILWFMRWSAKLNLFFGVPNVNADWFPDHLKYLTTYIRRSPVSIVFPITFTLAMVVETVILTRVFNSLDAQVQFGYLLAATLLALGLLEHLFMILPMGDARLWNWAKRAATRQRGNQPH